MRAAIDVAIIVVIATFLAVSALHARQVDENAEHEWLFEERGMDA